LLKEILEDIRGNVNKFKQYLIEMYGYEEKDIKIEYKINGFMADLVILRSEKPFIAFELKPKFNGLSNYKKQIFSAYLGKIDYFALVIPYENEWYMECYDKSGKLIENIPFNKKVSEKLISKKLYDFFYRGGKEDIKTVEDKIFYTLLNYSFLKENYKNNQITPIAILNKIKSFSLNEQEIFIVLRLLSFIKVKNNKKLIENIFDLTVDKKSGILSFKIEFLEFLNNLVKEEDYYIIGFQPDMIKLNFNKCFIKDKNKYADLVKNLLDCNKNKNIFNILYIDHSNIYLNEIDFTQYKNGILIVGYNFFNAIKKHPKFREITKKIKMIINFDEPIFDNSMASFSLIFLGQESENIYIANLDFERLFKYENEIVRFINNNEKIEENDDIFFISNEDFEKEKIEFIKILNVIKKIENKPHKKLQDLAEIISGNSCKEKGDIQKLITLKSIKYNKIFSLEYISEKCYKKNKNKLTREDDFIISKIGNYKFIEITKKYENCVIDDDLFIIRPKNKESYEIIKKFLFSDLGKYIFNNIKSGFRVIGKIFIKDLKDILIPLEDLNIEIKYKEKIEEQYFLPCDKKNINFIGIKDRVLNFETVAGFLIKKDIKKIEKIEPADFQRDLNEKHLSAIKKFLENKEAKYKFLSFLVFGIENFDNIDKEEYQMENMTICQLCLNKENFEKNIKIIDGNHRWNAIKEKIDSLKEDFQIGVVFIILEENAFSPIFYTLNSKSMPLISSDYVNLMEQDREIVNELKELGMNSPSIYFEFKNYFETKNIFNYKLKLEKQKKEIDENILKLVEFIEKNDLVKRKKFFKLAFSILNKSDYKFNNISIYFDITKSILKYYNESYKDKKEICYSYNFKKFKLFFQREFNDFYQYLKETKLIEKIDKLDLYPIFETYKQTYVPKSKKIYLSMPYHIHEDLIYFVMKDIVNEVSNKLGEKIELIRTDKRKLGVHKQIESKIYEEIEESDLLIADITGNNPNVFAEVGYKMALDKSKGLKEPQIIFIKNTRGYYERTLYYEKTNNEEREEIIIDEHIRKNKVTNVAFNFAHIDQIEFSDVEFLKKELENMLLKYFNYYQIKKV
jgi:hypothetical protein